MATIIYVGVEETSQHQRNSQLDDVDLDGQSYILAPQVPNLHLPNYSAQPSTSSSSSPSPSSSANSAAAIQKKRLSNDSATGKGPNSSETPSYVLIVVLPPLAVYRAAQRLLSAHVLLSLMLTVSIVLLPAAWLHALWFCRLLRERLAANEALHEQGQISTISPVTYLDFYHFPPNELDSKTQSGKKRSPKLLTNLSKWGKPSVHPENNAPPSRSASIYRTLVY